MLASAIIGACVAFAANAVGLEINNWRWWLFVLPMIVAFGVALHG